MRSELPGFRDRRQRLVDVLAAIELPAGARVLHFGCGIGDLTRLLELRWPDAEIVGVDTDPQSIDVARRSSRRAYFGLFDAAFANAHAGKFDFVLSHHVLDRMLYLEGAIKDLARLTGDGGQMLHVLSNGDAGMRARPTDLLGADVQLLTAGDLFTAFLQHGRWRVELAYGEHSIGWLRRMSESRSRAWLSLNDDVATRSWFGGALTMLWFGALACLRAPARALFGGCRGWMWLPALVLAPISLPVELLLWWLDRREWHRRRSDPRGGEVFVRLFRIAAAPAPSVAPPVVSTPETMPTPQP